MIKYVYVAGPISKGDPFFNVAEGVRWAEAVRAAGLVPFCPHLSGLWQMIKPVDYEAWLTYDFAWIERCDALLRMPGASPGAEREVAFAKKLGIPVFTNINEILMANKAKDRGLDCMCRDHI